MSLADLFGLARAGANRDGGFLTDTPYRRRELTRARQSSLTCVEAWGQSGMAILAQGECATRHICPRLGRTSPHISDQPDLIWRYPSYVAWPRIATPPSCPKCKRP